MKRFLAIGLAASLVFSGCLAAYGDDYDEDYYEESEYSGESGAESTESVVDTAGTTPEEALVFTEAADVNHDYYNGVWVDTGVGVKLWLPEYWEAKELSEDAAKQGLVFRYGDSDGMSVSVTQSKLPKAALPYTMDDFFLELKDHYGTVQYAVINGVSCLIFEDSEQAMSGFATILKKGYTIVGVITPPSRYEWSDYKYFINNIIHSVSESDPVAEEVPAAESESSGTESGTGESPESSQEEGEKSESSEDSGSEEEGENAEDSGLEDEGEYTEDSGSEDEGENTGDSGSEGEGENSGDSGSDEETESSGDSSSGEEGENTEDSDSEGEDDE